MSFFKKKCQNIVKKKEEASSTPLRSMGGNCNDFSLLLVTGELLDLIKKCEKIMSY